MLRQLNLTSEQLFAIVECDSVQDLENQLSEQQLQALTDYQKKLFFVKKTVQLNPSLLSIINDVSTPIDILWGLTNIIGYGVVASVLSLFFLTLVPLIGGVFCYYAYKKSQEKSHELTEFFQLSYLKLEAAEEYNRLENRQISVAAIAVSAESALTQASFVAKINRTFDAKQKTVNLPMVNSIGLSMSTALTLFGSYFLGLSSIMGTLGFMTLASALTGPIGIGIAIGISLGVSIYIGYKHYQAKKNYKIVEACQSELNSKIKSQQSTCNRIKTINEISCLITEKKLLPDEKSAVVVDVNSQPVPVQAVVSRQGIFKPAPCVSRSLGSEPVAALAVQTKKP